MADKSNKKKKASSSSQRRREEDMDENDNIEVEQSDGARRAIRNDIRSLIHDIKDNQLDYSDPKSEKLSDTLSKANCIFKNVKKAREGALDSQLVLQIAQSGRQKAQRLNTDFLVFNPKNFIQRAASVVTRQTLERLGDEDEHKVENEEWEIFGQSTLHLFKTSPSLQFMFGAFEREPTAPRPRKERRAKEKETNAKTDVKEIKNMKEASTEEATSSEVEKIYRLLHEETKPDSGSKNPKPMCYFEFVVNPESFSQTVENIFYTSFLIKDGLAKVSLDADKLPVIESIERPKEGTREAEKVEKVQVVMPITMADWQEIVKTYGIQEATIPTRAKCDAAGLKRKK